MSPTSTVAEAIDSPAGLRLGRAGRRVTALVVLAVVFGGASSLLGGRADVATDTGDGYALAVEYPSRTRAGLTHDLVIVVRRAEAFDAPVTVVASLDYLALFEEQGMQPQPSSSTATADHVEWKFDPPEGDTLRIIYDLRVEPHRHRGAAGTVSVRDGDAEPVSVRLETAVMP